MQWYLLWVSESPLLSAAIQFGILGSLGELISFWLRKRTFQLPCSYAMLIGKILAWALLGIIIKYGFAGMRGFLDAGMFHPDHPLLPDAFRTGLLHAFALSVLTNVFFGPQMMLFHRLEENLLAWRLDLSNLQKPWWTLVWFWIPAHTITFMLPKPYQIGLAAIWSIALGLIMGFTAPKTTENQ